METERLLPSSETFPEHLKCPFANLPFPLFADMKRLLAGDIHGLSPQETCVSDETHNGRRSWRRNGAVGNNAR